MSDLWNVQQRLNQHLLQWNAVTVEFRRAVRRASEAKADYEHQAAVFKVKQRAADPKASMMWLETLADADPDVHRLNVERLAAESEVAALDKRLQWSRAAADAFRSEISSERAQAVLFADDRSVP